VELLAVIAGLFGAVLLSSWWSRRRTPTLLLDGADETVFGAPRYPVEIPWRGDADLGARFALRASSDAFLYQSRQTDKDGHTVQPEIIYDRHSVTWSTAPPGLKRIAEQSTAGFAELMRDWSRVDDFPAPDGKGVATVRQQLPPGVSE